jgi:nucleotide-binding universal stress UspA family protein
MKRKVHNQLRVLWAIDLLASDKKVRASAESLLKVLSKLTSLEIHPSYIVRFSEQAQPLSQGQERKILIANVQEAMKKWLSGVKLQLEEPRAVLQKGVYLRSDVDALVSEAKKAKVDFILVNTHARKGFSRFWMGSFAETLMHQSTIPVLFLNPSSKPVSGIKTILFPTNLSPDSQKAMRKVGEMANRLRAELVLYYNVEYFAATSGLALSEMMILTENIEKDVKERKKTLEKWANQVKKEYGIKVKIIIDDSDVRVSNGIIKASQRLPACMIAMAAQTGPVLSVLVGSTTRRVVREAGVPVLALR